MIVQILLSALALLAAVFVIALGRQAVKRQQMLPTLEAVALGAVTNFFDTLGIGSFAPTTAWIRMRRMVPDSYIPAVLNVGHALPTVAEALIFVTLVKVDPWLLGACIAAAIVGAVVGAPIVLRLPLRAVQAVVGLALLAAAATFVVKNLHMMPGGGDALRLPPEAFAIGLFAPSLILLPLLGMNPTAAFPIMMGACAFLMPVSGFQFLRSERIDLRVVIGFALGGIPAVLVAAFVVKSMPLEALRWGVVVVVLYAAATLIWSALRPAKMVAEQTSKLGSARAPN